jgi:hypothetical protein
MDRMQRLMPIKYWDLIVRRGRKVMQKVAQRRTKSAQA